MQTPLNEEICRTHLSDIFSVAVEAANPYKLIKESVFFKDGRIVVGRGSSVEKINPADFERIFVIGAGKASGMMAKAMEEILGKRISSGTVCVKYGYAAGLERIKEIEAGHPVPDENGHAAALKIAETACLADEKTLVFGLFSGGGSALLTLPISSGHPGSHGLEISEKQDLTKRLLQCGAEIDEINCIRKHLSSIKGGRLAELIFPARSINLFLSDVVGDRLDVIASGPTVPDPSTYSDAKKILEKYALIDDLPPSILSLIESGCKGAIPETPKPGNKVFSRVTNLIIGSNAGSIDAAEKEAKALGYNTMVLSSRLTGDAKNAAVLFFGIAKEVKDRNRPVPVPACILCGGETTVKVKGTGSGGRNQEMALAFLKEMKKDEEKGRGIFFLSGATDGGDGPTDAAGATVSTKSLERASKAKLDIGAFLENNDSYNFFLRTGDLLKTGPTLTNVCDIQILLVV